MLNVLVIVVGALTYSITALFGSEYKWTIMLYYVALCVVSAVKGDCKCLYDIYPLAKHITE